MSRLATYLRVTATVAAAALFVLPAAAEAPKLPNLDAALSAVAPKILKELRDRKYENVGVLKFLVADGDGQPRGNVGSLNRTLADRLEVALALANEDAQFGIIAHASDAVAQAPNADRINLLTPDGRAELFKIRPNKFTVLWKPNTSIKPDAFLTGVAKLSPDRRTVTVKVQVCDRAHAQKKELDILAEFTAANDLRTLTEIGVTYARGGVKAEGDLLVMSGPTAPAGDDTADDLKKKAGEALAQLTGAPVQLEILYDGQAQTPKADVGSKYQTNVLLSVPPPEESTKAVSFHLTNRSHDTYGVVLRVNGLNTIYKEQQAPRACHKWILKPGDIVLVEGFQSDEKDAPLFKVAAPTREQLNSLSPGNSLGTIDLILFRGMPKPEPVNVQVDPKTKDKEAVAMAVARGAMALQGQPANSDLQAYKDQLKSEGTEFTRRGRDGGLIQEGDKDKKNLIKKVEFYSAPEAELSATIRYYTLNK